MSLRPELLAAPAYAFTARPQPIKLDQNESPYDLPEALREAVLERLATVPFNRYPALLAEGLRARIAARHGWPEDGVVLAGGSNILIQALLIASGIGRSALTLKPTFSVYAQQARVLGIPVLECPLLDDFALPVDALTRRLGAAQGALFIANPAAPTGNLHPQGEIAALAEASAGRWLFALDEAYCDFAGSDGSAFIEHHPHLVSLRTLSKAAGLAGARLGYALARPEVAREVQKAVLPFSVSALQIAVGETVLDHAGFVAARVAEAVAERSRMFAALGAMPGVRVFPSSANFLLLRLPDAGATFEALLAAGVVVRRQDQLPGLVGCLRVSVGKPSENDAFLRALAAHLSARRDEGIPEASRA